jgi:hypothetical protein
MTSRRMRQWSQSSYDPKTGRAVSAYGDGGSFSADGIRVSGSAQIDRARSGGQKGAPGVSALSPSGSGDKGRNKWGASTNK